LTALSDIGIKPDIVAGSFGKGENSPGLFDVVLDSVKIMQDRITSSRMVGDGQLAVIGSANADMRSFRYNFEVNVQVYSKDFAKKAEQVFFADLGKSMELTKAFLNRPTRIRFVENMFRLLSPLL